MIHTLRTAMLAGITALTIHCSYAVAAEAEEIKLNDTTKRLSYSLGYQIGGDFKRQGAELDSAAVVAGIEDALAGADPKIPHKAMNELLIEMKRKVVAAQRQELAKKATSSRERGLAYIAEGREFLKENAKKPGVKTTKSGLQYKIIEPGSDKKPGPTDEVTVNYRGNLIDGHEFDSSYKNKEPATFSLDGVIPGWTEGLQLIGEGGRIQLFVPSVLAYRNRGPLGHRTLIFDVELLSVKKTSEKDAPRQ
ncbi:MAG: FKBP-type peptidyl-prolyl cis-trans isomerase [Gammaproteobacteria bacterium]|jgi:FKBP-type peptidyl-prolyl cis-trans isomerase FklB